MSNEIITLNNGVEMPAVGLGVFQTPPEETTASVEEALRVGYRHVELEKLLADGKVRAIGVSNFMPEHLDRLLADASVIPAVNQIEVHPYFQQTELQRVNDKYGVLTQAWSPIGGITSYRGGGRSTFDDPTLLEIAGRHGKSAAQVMLRWHLQEGRSVIPKSTKPARIAENFDVFDFELTADELAAIDVLDTGVRGGPEPDSITLEAFGRDIPEA